MCGSACFPSTAVWRFEWSTMARALAHKLPSLQAVADSGDAISCE
jgi:hypothetical protein